MASEPEWSCPICREVSAEIAYVGSCLHEFCRSCIVRWARKNPSCPLCRQVVHTIIYPTAPSLEFLEVVIPQPFVHVSAGPSQMPGAAGPQLYVAGFTPEAWAFFFRNYAEILRPVELWLNEVLYGSSWWDLAFAYGKVVSSLCRFGLHEEALARELRPFLREQTHAFVRQLIDVASEHCSELALRFMEIAAIPVAGPGAAASSAQEEPREQPGPAGAEASGSGQSSGDSAAGPSGSSASRRTGGSQGSSAAQEEPCHR